jgi:hypothetical protein
VLWLACKVHRLLDCTRFVSSSEDLIRRDSGLNWLSSTLLNLRLQITRFQNFEDQVKRGVKIHIADQVDGEAPVAVGL